MSAPSANTRPNAPTRPASENLSAAPAQTPGGFYPGLAAYMGLELSEDVIRANMPEYLPSYQQGNSALVQRQVSQTFDLFPEKNESQVRLLSSRSLFAHLYSLRPKLF